MKIVTAINGIMISVISAAHKTQTWTWRIANQKSSRIETLESFDDNWEKSYRKWSTMRWNAQITSILVFVWWFSWTAFFSFKKHRNSLLKYSLALQGLFCFNPIDNKQNQRTECDVIYTHIHAKHCVVMMFHHFNFLYIRNTRQKNASQWQQNHVATLFQ